MAMAWMVSPAIPIIVDGRALRNDAKQSQYQTQVSKIVRKIAASRVGRAIIDEIAAAKFFVAVEPEPQDSAAKFFATMPPNVGELFPRIDPDRIQWDDKHKIEARAQNAFVLFSPGFAARAKRVQPGLAIGMFDEDSALAHELFHAMRLVQGRIRLLPIKGPYTNREEFYGTVIENTYRSEHGRQALRQSYNNLTQAGNYLSITGIYDDYSFELTSLIGESCTFATRIGAIDCKFNPIREVLRGNYDNHKVMLSNQCGITRPIR